jgi:hypothetical protein
MDLTTEVKEFAQWMIAFHNTFLESKGLKDEFDTWLRERLDNNEDGIKGRFGDWLDQEVSKTAELNEIFGNL